MWPGGNRAKYPFEAHQVRLKLRLTFKKLLKIQGAGESGENGNGSLLDKASASRTSISNRPDSRVMSTSPPSEAVPRDQVIW